MAFRAESLTAAGFAFACLTAACAPSARVVRVDQRAVTPAAATVTAPSSDRVVVRLTSDPDTEGRVLAEVRLEGALASVRSLRFAPAHDALIDIVSARDPAGEIEVRREGEGSATRFVLGRRGAGALEVHYRVTYGPKSDAHSPHAELIELSVGGEDALLLPDTDERFPVEIRLKAGRVASRGASSFALGTEQHVVATPTELRGAYYFAGDVGTATFHASDGDDFAAWIGFTAFDPRGASAETAGVRAEVDAYVGRSTSLDGPPNSILFTSTRKGGPPFVVSRRTRGLVISVERRATWTPAVRILVAQALTRRYIGGFLFVGDRKDEASGYFFGEGFSRTIARELLFEASLLSPADRAAELNSLLASVAFAADPHALVAARGALAATALDVALRKSTEGEHSLRTFLRARLAQAATEAKDTLSFADLVARVRESAGERSASELEAVLHHGAEAFWSVVELRRPSVRDRSER